jgi:hypothetical protein
VSAMDAGKLLRYFADTALQVRDRQPAADLTTDALAAVCMAHDIGALERRARLIVLGSVTETGLSLHCLANALTPNTANAGELKLAGHYTVAGSAACSWSLWLTSMLCHLRMTFA